MDVSPCPSIFGMMAGMDRARPHSFFRAHITKIRSFLKLYAVHFLLGTLLVVMVVSTIVLKIQTGKTQDVSVALFNLQTQHQTVLNAFDALKQQDPYKVNIELEEELKQLKAAYISAVDTYEALVAYREDVKDTQKQDVAFVAALTHLAEGNIASASAALIALEKNIQEEVAKRTASPVPVAANVPEHSEPPGSGYRRQKVSVDGTTFLVDIVTADLNTTKAVVDTASDGTCTQDCPVLSLADYVSRNGAYAGINGTYFCPETYPSCADKKNTFDVLVMNKNKVYFNSDNNVYSTVPVTVFSGNSIRILSKTQDWGRDQGVDAVIANRPLLVSDGNNMFGGNDDAKESSRSNRSFVGGDGSTAYIGVVHSATVAESAKVLHAMGIRNAMNLDSGGSTALWVSGYKVGPGRNLPNVLLFVRK